MTFHIFIINLYRSNYKRLNFNLPRCIYFDDDLYKNAYPHLLPAKI